MGVYKFLKCVTVLGFQMIMNVIVNEYLIWFVATVFITTAARCCDNNNSKLLLLFTTTAARYCDNNSSSFGF